MKRKFLARLLSLVMVLSLMPVSAFATEVEPETGEGNTPGTLGTLVGVVKEITSTGNVAHIETGKDKVTVTPIARIPWSEADAEIGRKKDGCWIGIDIIAPNQNISPENVKFRNYSNKQDRVWDDADDGTIEDGRYHMGAWGLATPDLFNQAKGKDLVYTWYFNWDGNVETGVTIPKEDFIKPTGEPIEGAADMEGVDQIVTLSFNPYAVTLLDENGGVAWPLATAPKVVLRKQDIKLAPLTGGDANDPKGGNCTTYNMDRLTSDPNYGETTGIVLRADNLKAHKNGENKEGYWAGFAVTLPEDLKGAYATSSDSIQVKAIFSDKDADTTAEKLKEVVARSLESNVDGDGNPGYTFYTNVGEENQKKYAILQFVNREGIPLTREYKFHIDTAHVHPVSYDISIMLSEGGDSQIDFAEDKYSYVVNVEEDQDSIILTTDENAFIKVNGKQDGAGTITLKEGVNTIEVKIGSVAIKTYTIKVVKPGADNGSVNTDNPGTSTDNKVSATIPEDSALQAISNAKTDGTSNDTAVFNTVAYPEKQYSVNNVEVTLLANVNESLLGCNVAAKIETDLIDVTLTPEAIKKALTDKNGKPVPQDLKLVIKKADVSDLSEGLRKRAVAVDVSIEDKDGESVEVSGLSDDDAIELAFPIPDELAPFVETMYAAWYNPDEKKYESIRAGYDATKDCYVAKTTHLSKFAMYADPVSEQLEIKIAGEPKRIEFLNGAASYPIGSVGYITVALPNGANFIGVTGGTYENGRLTITGSGNTEAVIKFKRDNKTYTLTLVRPSARPEDLKVTWEPVEHSYDYYGGILTIDHLDPYKTYLVTFDNGLAVKSGTNKEVPRITTVVKGKSKVILSCQDVMKVIVWKVPDGQPTDYADWEPEDVVFCNREAFEGDPNKINENLGVQADRIPMR